MDKSKDHPKDKIHSLIKYLAMTGGREKVSTLLFSYVVWFSISVVSW